jgi:hypothetical protein
VGYGGVKSSGKASRALEMVKGVLRVDDSLGVVFLPLNVW